MCHVRVRVRTRSIRLCSLIALHPGFWFVAMVCISFISKDVDNKTILECEQWLE